MTNDKKPSNKKRKRGPHRREERSSNKGAKRQHFELKIPELVLGESHPELIKVQTYLGRAGYLSEAYESARLDEPTQIALKKFQRYRRLDQTGTTDESTVRRLIDPKCGYPDLPTGSRDATTEFALDATPNLIIGCDYRPANELTYTLVNRTPDLGTGFSTVNDVIARAFATWQAAIAVDFVFAEGDNSATFKVGWFTDSHGDGDDFDFIGGVIAHAFAPPPCGDPHAGLCHFDEAERWGLNQNAAAPRVFDLETQALHEIGHLLGLTHSSDPASIMFSDYRFVPDVASRRRLSPDVKTAIQSIYGARN